MSMGAQRRFEDGVDELNAANLNTLGRPGNVWARLAGGLFVDIGTFDWYDHSAAEYFTYAGTTNQAVVANQTNYFWVDSSNALQTNTTGFPSAGTSHIRLATVVTDGVGVTAINDKRPLASLA